MTSKPPRSHLLLVRKQSLPWKCGVCKHHAPTAPLAAPRAVKSPSRGAAEGKMPATPNVSPPVPLLLAEWFWEHFWIFLFLADTALGAELLGVDWDSQKMFSYLLGYWFYTSACISQCCVQCCLCLYGVGPCWGHSKGFPIIKIQGNFSCPTCPFPVLSAVFSIHVKSWWSGCLPSWLLCWVLLLLLMPLPHSPAGCCSSRFPPFPTGDHEQGAGRVCGLVGTGVFLRWCCSGGGHSTAQLWKQK